MLELAHNPRRGERLEVEIEALQADGTAIGYIEAEIGPQRARRVLRVEVRGAVPGDRVRVDVGGCHRGVVSGRIDALLVEAPTRTTPRCRHFVAGPTGCGGCTLQWLPEAAQASLKRDAVVRALAQAGVSEEGIAAMLPTPSPWGWRNKMEYSFGFDGAGRFALGLHPAGRKWDVLRLEECHLQSAFSARLVVAAREHAQARGLEAWRPRDGGGWLRTLTVREGKRTGERLVELTTTGAAEALTCEGVADPAAEAAALGDSLLRVAAEAGEALTSVVWTRHHAAAGTRTTLEHVVLHGPGVLHEALHLPGGHTLRFEIAPRAFFQPNTLGAERLYAQVLALSGLLDGRARGALDLYCGTGTIGLCMAPFAARVLGIELVADAVRNAESNARYNGIDHVEFIAGDVGEVLERAAPSLLADLDLIVVDPPRSGLIPRARAHIQAIPAPRLIYVSCNPEALGRDLIGLQSAGWRLEAVQPVDMFPQTAHVETIAALRRVDDLES